MEGIQKDPMLANCLNEHNKTVDGARKGLVAKRAALLKSGTYHEQSHMDKEDCLAHYPFVVVRIRCRVCSRKGSYRLARIAAEHGPEISLRDLLD
jgi:hypothetical protein